MSSLLATLMKRQEPLLRVNTLSEYIQPRLNYWCLLAL